MRYRIFLYRAVTLPGFAPPTGTINAVIRTNTEGAWKVSGAAQLLEAFDAASVLRYIQDTLADPKTKTGKGFPLVRLPPHPFAQTPYIYVATSTIQAADVLSRLYAIALENGLVLYDAETDRVFYSGSPLGADDVVDRGYITMLDRHFALCHAIREDMSLLYSLRWLDTHFEAGNSDCAFAVTLRKDAQRSFALRNEDFYTLLTRQLAGDETLCGEDLCYCIHGPGYTIRFTLEGYKKDANLIGCIENGKPYVTLLHRMGTEKAFRWIRTNLRFNGQEVQAIQRRMSSFFLRRDYPDPAQRFVKSVKISMRQKRLALKSAQALAGTDVLSTSTGAEMPAAIDERRDPYGEPILCDEIVYEVSRCRVRKLWTWTASWIWQDDDTGLLIASFPGPAQDRYSTFVTVAGSRVTGRIFDSISSFYEGLSGVSVHGQGCGYVDEDMRLVIPPLFDAVNPFRQGKAQVRVGERWFFIDRTGHALPNTLPVAKRIYRDVDDFSEGMARVSIMNYGKWFLDYYSDELDDDGVIGYIDETGKEVIPPRYIYAYDFAGGVAIVARGHWPDAPGEDGHMHSEEWWGGIDKTGQAVIPFIFDEIKRFDECFDAYMAHYGGWKNGHWGVIDRNGNWLAPPIFGDLDYRFHDGLFAFYAQPDDPSAYDPDPPLGIYDCKQQKVLFEPRFSDVEFLLDGDILVEVFDKNLNHYMQKIIDRSGKERFPSTYSSISTWRGEPYDVEILNEAGKKCGLVDCQGHMILPCIFDHSPRQAWLEHRPTIFTQNGRQGVMALDGRVILPARYYKVDDLEFPLYTVSVGDKESSQKGLILPSGEAVLPTEYSNIGWCRDGKHFYCCRPGLCEMYEYEPLI